MKHTRLPALSGIELISLLIKDGWEIKRRTRHGISLAKSFRNRTRVTVIPTSADPLPKGTLMAILGQKQTGVGKKDLWEIINKIKSH